MGQIFSTNLSSHVWMKETFFGPPAISANSIINQLVEEKVQRTADRETDGSAAALQGRPLESDNR